MPEDFGKISLIIIFVAIFSTIFEQGYLNSLLIGKNIKTIDLNTIFYFSIFLGILSYIFIFFISDLVAKFYQIEELSLLLRILGVSVIFNSFLVVFKYELMKELKYKKQALITLVSGIVSGVVAIIMAANHFEAWSLVAKTLIMNIMITVLMISTSKWRPILAFNFGILKKHFKNGNNIMLVGILETLYSYSLNIVIGKYYGVRELGYYTNAQKFTQIIGNAFILVSKKFSLSVIPSFNDMKKVTIINNSVTYLNAIILPIILFILLNSDLIITLLLGEQWIGTVMYFEVFILIAYFNILIKQYLILTEVLNKTSLLVKLESSFKIVAIGLSIMLIINGTDLILILLTLLFIHIIYFLIYLIMYIDKINFIFGCLFIITSILFILSLRQGIFSEGNIWIGNVILFFILALVNTTLIIYYKKIRGGE